jgi:hypothetical protein
MNNEISSNVNKPPYATMFLVLIFIMTIFYIYILYFKFSIDLYIFYIV